MDVIPQIYDTLHRLEDLQQKVKTCQDIATAAQLRTEARQLVGVIQLQSKALGDQFAPLVETQERKLASTAGADALARLRARRREAAIDTLRNVVPTNRIDEQEVEDSGAINASTEEIKLEPTEVTPAESQGDKPKEERPKGKKVTKK